MIAVFGDESYDDHTYVLGGWLITPTHYQILRELWDEMLGGFKLANGCACPAFHAQAIMSQSGIYQGWTKDEAFHAFDQATAVLAERPGRFAASPCAVATQIPPALAKADKDVIWKTLFMRFFALVLEKQDGGEGGIRTLQGLLESAGCSNHYASEATDPIVARVHCTELHRTDGL